MTTRFPKAARVRVGADYSRVFAQGRRVADPVMALHVLAGGELARLGLAVSRKVDPHAVGRNRIKRVLRASFRQLRDQLPAGDYVLVARNAAARTPNPHLRSVLHALLVRAGALPPPAAAGTMRPACAPSSASPSTPDTRPG